MIEIVIIFILFLFFFMKVMKPLPKVFKNDFGKLDFVVEGFPNE